MNDCRDIGGSGQFLITKVLISVAKWFIEIRIVCVCVTERGRWRKWMESFESTPGYFLHLQEWRRENPPGVENCSQQIHLHTSAHTRTHTNRHTRWTDEGNCIGSKKDSTPYDFTVGRLSLCGSIFGCTFCLSSCLSVCMTSSLHY